jgi:hypothetical protein
MDGKEAIPGLPLTVVIQLVKRNATGVRREDDPLQTKKDVSRSHVRAFGARRFHRIRSILSREASRDAAFIMNDFGYLNSLHPAFPPLNSVA